MEARVAHGTGDGVGIVVIVTGEHVADVEAGSFPGIGVGALFKEHDVVAELQARERAHTLPAVLIDLERSINLLLLL